MTAIAITSYLTGSTEWKVVNMNQSILDINDIILN